MAYVFRNIEAERVRKGLERKELAELLGVTSKTYYNWVSHKTEIPMSKLKQMADLFGVTTDYLFTQYEN